MGVSLYDAEEAIGSLHMKRLSSALMMCLLKVIVDYAGHLRPAATGSNCERQAPRCQDKSLAFIVPSQTFDSVYSMRLSKYYRPTAGSAVSPCFDSRGS